MADAPKVKEETTRIPLSDIRVDFAWNCRQGGWQNEQADKDGKYQERQDGGIGFLGLIDSIAKHGQDTAVDVRPNSRGGKQPYELVTGFRRYEALRRLNEKGVQVPKGGTPDQPTVFAHVRNLSEAEAIALNARENIARDNISAADTAHVVANLMAKGMVQADVADKIGKSQGYVSKLHTIMADTKKDIIAAWRDMPTDPLTIVERVELSKLPKGDQDEAYKKLLEGHAGGKKRSGGGAGAWLKTAKAQARAVGALFGKLEYHSLLSTDDLDFDSAECVKTLVDCSRTKEGSLIRVKASATDKQWEQIGEALSSGYAQGQDEAEKAEKAAAEEQAKTEAEKKNAKGAKAA